jgi:hypothetical protein
LNSLISDISIGDNLENKDVLLSLAIILEKRIEKTFDVEWEGNKPQEEWSSPNEPLQKGCECHTC